METTKKRRAGRRRELTQREFAEMGGRAVLKKYGRRQLREWGKLGGRPRKNRRKPSG